MSLLSFLGRVSNVKPNLPRHGTQTDPRIVVAAYAKALEFANPPLGTIARDVAQLPFDKETVNWALKFALAQAQDSTERSVIEQGYMLLGWYQDIGAHQREGRDPNLAAVEEMQARLAELQSLTDAPKSEVT